LAERLARVRYAPIATKFRKPLPITALIAEEIPTPSRADIEMTKQIFEIARGLGIEVHDHIIVGRDGHAG
jgi:hypothetical protein